MKIAIDLSVLQTAHRYRGVGAVVVNFINNIPASYRTTDEFVFFMNKADSKEVIDILDLKNLRHSIRFIKSSRAWPGKNTIPKRIISNILGRLEYISGDERISKSQLSDIDHFIQFEQNSKLPKRARKHTTLILYDLIPFIMESDYLFSYKTARLHGHSRKVSIKAAIQRYEYIYKLKINCKRAKNLIAISEHTKRDFVKYVGVKEAKISVCYLGADSPKSTLSANAKFKTFKAYKPSPWGEVRRSITLGDKPFLLFIGGADPRRELVELYAAYCNLRARGVEIALVFAGDTMLNPEHIPHTLLRNYIHNNPSYKEDVHFLGFVSDTQREWLYAHALTCVYPSLYEGFGLPVIEAMKHGTPVITYDNSSISEIAADAVLYAKGSMEIFKHINTLLDDESIRNKYRKRGLIQSKKFNWQKTTNELLGLLHE